MYSCETILPIIQYFSSCFMKSRACMSDVTYWQLVYVFHCVTCLSQLCVLYLGSSDTEVVTTQTHSNTY